MYRYENTVTLLDFIESVFDTGVDLYSFIHNKLEKNFGSQFGYQLKHFISMHGLIEEVQSEADNLRSDILKSKEVDVYDNIEYIIQSIDRISDNVTKKSMVYLEEIYTKDTGLDDLIAELNWFDDELNKIKSFYDDIYQ